MTSEELAAIESALNIVLPNHYREFMLNYPIALAEARLDLGHEQQSPEDSYLLNHADAVIEVNQSVREPGLMLLNGETQPWDDNYIVVGRDVGGNMWCVKRGNRSRSVWFFDHEEGYYSRQSRSLQEYAEYTLRFIEEFNAPDEEDEDEE
jgi:hypothetical protein